MKFVTGMAAALLLLHSLAGTGYAAEPSALQGDCNADGQTDAADALLLRDWLLAKGDAAAPDFPAADLSGDGRLNAADLALLKQNLLPAQKTVTVSDIGGLFRAMRGASPGDIIRLLPGTYDYTGYDGAQKIDTTVSGTADAPITLTAADPEHPPVLRGTAPESGYVLHIQGEYWILDRLTVTTAQKGIVFDHASHSVIRNCEICNTGAEAVALRDGSSDCIVEKCLIHDSGLVTPGYGEGVYIGSAVSVTGFDYRCDRNKVLNCTFRGIAAEHIDVKEFTTGTEIGGCTFFGDGMTGENYAGSFIDIAGNDCCVHDNTGYRRGNPKIVAAFEIHDQADGWGYHAVFENNTLYLDQPYGAEDQSRPIYVVDGWFSDFTVRNNLADYGNGLMPAGPEHYNSDFVTFAD